MGTSVDDLEVVMFKGKIIDINRKTISKIPRDKMIHISELDSDKKYNLCLVSEDERFVSHIYDLGVDDMKKEIGRLSENYNFEGKIFIADYNGKEVDFGMNRRRD